MCVAMICQYKQRIRNLEISANILDFRLYLIGKRYQN